MDFELTYRRFSERSILVEWPSEIAKNTLDDMITFKNHLLNSGIKQIVQINVSYSSILVIYNNTIDKINDEILTLKMQYFHRENNNICVFRHWRIPVCYDDEFGLDLVEISEDKKLAKNEIIRLHSDVIYTVFFIGFLPGFLYLGGLDKRLHFPRKIRPRLNIKKGAVAIGGEQTGVYPKVSPGGWNIIGNSPVEFFNPKNTNPCFATSGDKIQFFQIDKIEYDAIASQVENGTYTLESVVING